MSNNEEPPRVWMTSIGWYDTPQPGGIEYARVDPPACAQQLMIKLYDPKRDGYESGSEGDFPLEQRALDRIAELEAMTSVRRIGELNAKVAELEAERDALDKTWRDWWASCRKRGTWMPSPPEGIEGLES